MVVGQRADLATRTVPAGAGAAQSDTVPSRYPALLRGVLRTVGAVAACVATAVAGQHRRPGRRFVLGAAAVGLQRRLELADAGVCRPVAVARHGAQPVVQRLPSVAALAVLLPAGHAAGTPAVVAASGAARTAGAGPAADLGRAWRAATGAGNTLAAVAGNTADAAGAGLCADGRRSGLQCHRSLPVAGASTPGRVVGTVHCGRANDPDPVRRAYPAGHGHAGKPGPAGWPCLARLGAAVGAAVPAAGDRGGVAVVMAVRARPSGNGDAAHRGLALGSRRTML
ncbi:hypothetical protein G6F22_012722 [Rhizopus arrhizus]|nr:hypothetical protein G6F22_012722 [Rhizopus arrhizus]KAG1219749.1 hypothetical protein G6F35_007239 [Rhizopus arrhizus]